MKKFEAFKSVLIHLIFWIIFVYLFVHNNILRNFPAVDQYKEYLIALMIMISSYINYFILVPRYYIPGYFAKFNTFFLLLILCLTSFEVAILYEDFQIVKQIIVTNPSRYGLQNILLITLRNFCILSLFFILKTSQYYRKRIQLEQKAFVNNQSCFNIIVSNNCIKTVKLDEIVYLNHKKNYTFFHLSNGEVYQMYISMSKIEDMLPKKDFIRVNRNIIINIKYELSTNENIITLDFKEKDATENTSFTVSNAYLK